MSHEIINVLPKSMLQNLSKYLLKVKVNIRMM